jgi:DNA replication protein DnaC
MVRLWDEVMTVDEANKRITMKYGFPDPKSFDSYLNYHKERERLTNGNSEYQEDVRALSASYVVQCECIAQSRPERMMKASLMSEWMRGCTHKNYETDNRPKSCIAAYNATWTYYNRFQKIRNSNQNSICLLGKSGTGKTHLLSAISNYLLHDGFSVLYFEHVNGIEDLKSNFDIMHEKVDLMKTVDVLFWDDMFKGRDLPTDFIMSKLFEVINYRYLHNLPMLISSERTIDDIADIDEALASRIYERSKNFIVTLDATAEEKGKGIKTNYRFT